MLVSEEMLLEHIQTTGKKETAEDLKKQFKVKGEEELNLFEHGLKQLEYSGDLYLDDKGFYHIFNDEIPFKQGIIHISKDGHGYVNIVNNGKEVNYMIYNRDLNGALPKDLVIIKPRGKHFLGHQIARVEKVLKRDKFLEIFEYQGDGEFKPYEVLSDFKVKVKNVQDLVPQSLVLLEVGETPAEIDGQLYFDGEIKKVIGHRDDPKIDEIAICLKYGFDHHFSKRIEEIVHKIPNGVLEEELVDRVDLRNKNIFTIDGKDTKDMDDAISIEKTDDGFILSVHIADVSHYLRSYPELIEEVINRGNSAYIADSVVPMLPHKLSNGICSLNPGEDRLTKTVDLYFDNSGRLKDYQVYRSVICSRKKMNYDDVNDILEKGEIPEGYENFAEDLLEMNKLSKLLTKNRRAKGCLVFDDLELKVYTDIDGKPVQIKRCLQRTAERLIENFMIMANIVVTENYGYLGQPFIYRVHEAPDLGKLKITLDILKEQMVVDPEKMNSLLTKVERAQTHHSYINPIDLQPILIDAENNGNLSAISNLLLRSMKKACYSNENIGHFGLAEMDYSHFTSPIRRAADALNHIIIDLIMDIEKVDTVEELMKIQAELNSYEYRLKSICEHISDMEVAAFNAEKEIEELKTVEYVAANIEDYTGPLNAQICQINKLGIGLVVDKKIKAVMTSDDLSALGFGYMRDSRTYFRRKDRDKFKLGTHLYVLDPEVSVQHRTICYHSSMTEDDYQKSVAQKPKTLVKSVPLN